MIKVGDLVRGKKEEDGNEYYGITSSESICKVGEMGDDGWIVVTLVSSQDYPVGMGI